MDKSFEKHQFKARKIPKTHKVPFMVYHSTKNLTVFNKSMPKGKGTQADRKCINRSKIYSLGEPAEPFSAPSRNCANDSNKRCTDYTLKVGDRVKESFHVPNEEEKKVDTSTVDPPQIDSENAKFKLEDIDRFISELDDDAKSLVSENTTYVNEQLAAMLSDPMNKTQQSQLNTSLDSKDTISVLGDRSPGKLENCNVLGGNIDFDQLLKANDV